MDTGTTGTGGTGVMAFGMIPRGACGATIPRGAIPAAGGACAILRGTVMGGTAGGGLGCVVMGIMGGGTPTAGTPGTNGGLGIGGTAGGVPCNRLVVTMPPVNKKKHKSTYLTLYYMSKLFNLMAL